MRGFFKFLLFLVCACAVIGAYGIYYRSAPGPLEQSVTVIIPRGSGFRGAVDILAAQGVIAHPLLFKGAAAVTGDARKFKAGEYYFESAISPRDVADMLAHGKVVPHKFTVPEGFTAADVIALLEGEAALSGEIGSEIEEGSLLPETYHFIYGDTREGLIVRMQADMATLLAQLWPQRKQGLPLATPQEAVTLASIVEKETGVGNERGRIAAVFINRLRLGMKLQSDPTTMYAIERDKGPLNRELLSNDLGYDSPYNTYAKAGLPPGPICNPGRAALEAVLNPWETDELYFVADGDGGHRFAKTIREHNANVRKYRQRHTNE